MRNLKLQLLTKHVDQFDEWMDGWIDTNKCDRKLSLVMLLIRNPETARLISFLVEFNYDTIWPIY